MTSRIITGITVQAISSGVLWLFWEGTGFRAALDHLAPLRIRVPGGGIRVDDSRATDEPRLFLIGYGPSASTIGANRAGRVAVAQIVSEMNSAHVPEPEPEPKVDTASSATAGALPGA